MKDKTVVVTGASGGIGSALSRAFAREGAQVALCYRKGRETAEALRDEIERENGNACVFRADVSRPEDVERLIQDVVNRFGGIDVLVNNAGGIHRRESILSLSLDAWNSAFEASVTGTFLCTQAAMPFILKSDQGRVINISSLHAVAGGREGLAGYASAKGSVISFTRTAAKEFGPYGVTVNAIVPGFIDVGMGHGIAPETKDAIAAQCPARRLGRGEDIAALGVFLASVQASYINGQAIRCDGGRFDYCL